MGKQEKKDKGYARLKMRLLLQIVGQMLLAVATIIILYGFIWFGRGADFVVFVLQRIFGMDYDTALYRYQFIFRENSSLFAVAAILLIFLLLLWFSFSRFTRYFSEINRGIDELSFEQEGKIQLREELAPVENKLNAVREKLLRQTAAAKEAEQRKNDLVMYLAHDIRTPLTSVIGYLSLLDEAPDLPPEQKAKYIHITLDKAIRLEHLVNEFFEITRTNSQMLTLQNEKVDLYYLLVQLLDEFYPLLSAKGNTAVLQADETMAVFGDAAKLARVFNNLLKNAASYSDPDTEIIVCAQQKEETVLVSFQNKGEGIPPERLEKLFDKFYRLDDARTTQTGGSGLGLSIAREIVQAHGGTITAASENDTVTISVVLPLEKNHSHLLTIS